MTAQISERNLASYQTKALQLLLIIIHQLNKDPESTSKYHDMEERMAQQKVLVHLYPWHYR